MMFIHLYLQMLYTFSVREDDHIVKKGAQAYRNWGPILSELFIMFDGRIQFFENQILYAII